MNNAESSKTGDLTRAMHVVLAGVIGLAFIGFVVGIRQGRTAPDISPTQRAGFASHPEAAPSTAYSSFDRRAFGPNHQWTSHLAKLPKHEVDLFAVPVWTDDDRHDFLSARARRRAFDGAPPVVPHPIDQMSAASCVACHGSGLSIGKGVHAPMMSHQFMSNCTQCHVELHATDLEPFLLAENTFEGRTAPFGGQRAWLGAPPVIPHATFMRENCMSCHGPAGADAIRTSHPWRANCLQCHAPSAVLDQISNNETPTWIESALPVQP